MFISPIHILGSHPMWYNSLLVFTMQCPLSLNTVHFGVFNSNMLITNKFHYSDYAFLEHKYNGGQI